MSDVDAGVLVVCRLSTVSTASMLARSLAGSSCCNNLWLSQQQRQHHQLRQYGEPPARTNDHEWIEQPAAPLSPLVLLLSLLLLLLSVLLSMRAAVRLERGAGGRSEASEPTSERSALPADAFYKTSNSAVTSRNRVTSGCVNNSSSA